METKTLNTTDICAIIKQCSESNVDKFEWGDLKFTFNAKKDTELDDYTPHFQGQEVSNLNSFIDDTEEVKQTELDVKFEQFANSVLEDPALAEEIMANEERLEELAHNLGASDDEY
jgi:hypothetical protein